jgi:hypothetical protein
MFMASGTVPASTFFCVYPPSMVCQAVDEFFASTSLVYMSPFQIRNLLPVTVYQRYIDFAIRVDFFWF